MNKIMRSTRSAIVVSIIFVLSTSLFAQESQSEASKKVQAEMEAAFGTFPAFMKALPQHLQPAAWKLMKDYDSPEAAIPAKYAHLISLAVASQIPCDYCVNHHTEMIKMLGGTEVEIQEAVAHAANTRFWSTILNGTGLEFEVIKKQTDLIMDYVKKQSKAK